MIFRSAERPQKQSLLPKRECHNYTTSGYLTRTVNRILNSSFIDAWNKNPLFNTYIEVDNINSSVYNVSDFSLINVTLQDTLFIKTEFNGGKDTNDNFDLNLYYTINEESKSVIGFKKSEL